MADRSRGHGAPGGPDIAVGSRPGPMTPEALRNVRRSLVDQASGLLAGRHGIGLDQARAMLRALAHQHRTDEAGIAATVLGLADSAAGAPAVPEPDGAFLAEVAQVASTVGADPAWRALREETPVRAAAHGRIVRSIAEATSDGDGAARLLVDLLGREVAAVVVFSVPAPDRAELVGQHGFTEEQTTAWRLVPLELDTPLREAVLTRRPVAAGTHAELVRRFPSLASTSSPFEATVGVPVLEHDLVAGLIVFGWHQPRDFSPELLDRLVSLAGQIGPPLLRAAAGGGRPHPAQEPDRGLLALLPDPWLALAARDVADGRDGDPGPDALVVREASPQLQDSAALVGQVLTGFWPAAGQDRRLREAIAALVRDGTPLRVSPQPGSAPPGAPAGAEVRGVRAGPLVVLTWPAGTSEAANAAAAEDPFAPIDRLSARFRPLTDPAG